MILVSNKYLFIVQQIAVVFIAEWVTYQECNLLKALSTPALRTFALKLSKLIYLLTLVLQSGDELLVSVTQIFGLRRLHFKDKACVKLP